MTDPVKIIVGEGDITEVQVPEYGIIQTGGGGGGSGSDGATFFPEVSQEGVISWTNDGGYDNPEPVNIKGPAGNDGSDGEDGQNGVTFTPSVSDAGIISWTNDGDLPNPSPVNIKGASGNDGEDGDDGTTFTPAVDASGNLSWTNDGGKQNPQTVNIKGPQGDAGQGVPAGGTTGQVLAKASNADYVTEWVDQSGGGGGTSDYDDLTDKPSINNVTLSGNKTAADLSLGTYSKPSTGIPQTDLAQAVQNKLDKTVVVSDTQPTETENKLWVDTDAGAGTSYQIPTVAEMEAADAQTAAEIGIVINGKRPSMAVTAGQYVIVRGSTISGVTDGLYTANTALSPSTDVSAANLTAVSGGGLNSLSALLDTAFKNITASVTGTTTAGENAWKYVPVTIPDGYRMFAVNSLRFSGTDATYIVLRGFEIDNSNSRVTLFFKNTTTSTTINYTATVWISCVKSDLF